VLILAEVGDVVELALPVNLTDDGMAWSLDVLYRNPWNSHLNHRWQDIYFEDTPLYNFFYKNYYQKKADWNPALNLDRGRWDSDQGWNPSTHAFDN
jgi:hypothetical protein